MNNFIKNILATIWLIIGAAFWVLLSSICPQIGLEEMENELWQLKE